MIRKRFVIGLLLLLIGLADLFFSRNLIYNYVYGPHPSPWGDCVRLVKPNYYRLLNLEETYTCISSFHTSLTTVYEPEGLTGYYELVRSSGYIIVRAEKNAGRKALTFNGVFIDCQFKTPEERELKKRIDERYAGSTEYPYVYFAATADVSSKKAFAWFQYITSVLMLVSGILFLLLSLFRRKLPSVNN